jgi:hypothetical protein
VLLWPDYSTDKLVYVYATRISRVIVYYAGGHPMTQSNVSNLPLPEVQSTRRCIYSR